MAQIIHYGALALSHMLVAGAQEKVMVGPLEASHAHDDAGITNPTCLQQHPEENAMRWFRIRKANIDPMLREQYEQYGVAILQLDFAAKKYFKVMPEGELTPAHKDENALLAWLTEQYDRTERKETWGLTLEVVITVFIAVEVLSLFYPALHWLIP